jgi:hypothetical protein
MTTACIALEITETGERLLDAYETACVLADLQRWDDEPAESMRAWPFSPERRVLGARPLAPPLQKKLSAA